MLSLFAVIRGRIKKDGCAQKWTFAKKHLWYAGWSNQLAKHSRFVLKKKGIMENPRLTLALRGPSGLTILKVWVTIFPLRKVVIPKLCNASHQIRMKFSLPYARDRQPKQFDDHWRQHPKVNTQTHFHCRAGYTLSPNSFQRISKICFMWLAETMALKLSNKFLAEGFIPVAHHLIISVDSQYLLLIVVKQNFRFLSKTCHTWSTAPFNCCFRNFVSNEYSSHSLIFQLN